MDPIKNTRFRDSFRAVADDIAKGLSNSRTASADGNWDKLTEFCGDVDLKPLLIWCRYHGPILNYFTQKYIKGAITPRRCRVQYCTVEDSMQSIGQTIAALGSR